MLSFKQSYLNTFLICNLLLVCWLYPSHEVYAQQTAASSVSSFQNLPVDSQAIKINNDSTVSKKKNPNQIEDEISYTATDSIVFYGNGTGYLYGGTDMKYQKINLKADFVQIKMDSNLIFARGTPDSLGVIKGEPVFTEGESEYSSKELTYNLRSRKGYIRQAVTQQGEAYIISDKTKKTDDDLLCMADGKYTTCDNQDHPHFYLSLSKAKVKPGSYIATGPAHLVVLDIPLPLIIPFGYFPFNSKYSSGIETPSFDTDVTRGYGLVNGGYYFALNDYADLSIKGDVYTRGTWGININSNYIKRYKFNGGLSVSYREDVIGEKDLPDYSKSKNLSIRWSHSQNAKVNPFRTFSASVNFSTSGYNRSNINSYYTPVNAENTKGSSVSFSQRFPNNPFSITGSFNIDQRTRDSTISLTLPNISISMSRIYPMKRKNAIGKERWYEKISMSYSGTISNSITANEREILQKSLAKDWKNGMQHNIPISASFNILKYITLSPSFNYTERWYLNSIVRSWDNDKQQVVQQTLNGFNRVYNFNMSVSANTTLYGMYTPIRSIFGDKVEKIRHVMTPSIGFGYTPDFGASTWGYWDSYIRTMINKGDPTKVTSEEIYYSRFENGLYGTPGRGKSGSISFSLGNNLEMKMKNPKDTTGLHPTKIVSLIDNFSLNGSYNLAADSMALSTIGSSLRLKFGKAYTLSLSGAFDPYMWGLGADGVSVRRINQLRWNNGKFPRFLGTSASYGYTFSNATFQRKNKNKKDNQNSGNGDNLNNNEYNNDPNNLNNPNNPDSPLNRNDGLNSSLEQTTTDADGYEKILIPWSFTVNYSLRYGDGTKFNYKKMEYNRVFSQNISFSGNIKLTPGWQISSTTSYDFTAKQFSYTSFNITRNLHCWTLSGNMVPFGPYKTYNFRIGVNASMLQDLKYEKQGTRSMNNITWY